MYMTVKFEDGVSIGPYLTVELLEDIIQTDIEYRVTGSWRPTLHIYNLDSFDIDTVYRVCYAQIGNGFIADTHRYNIKKKRRQLQFLQKERAPEITGEINVDTIVRISVRSWANAVFSMAHDTDMWRNMIPEWDTIDPWDKIAI
jgi:hypothetical protein